MSENPLFDDDEDEIIDLQQEVARLRAENRQLRDFAENQASLAANRESALRLTAHELEKLYALLSAVYKISRPEKISVDIIGLSRQNLTPPATGWIPMQSADQASQYPNSPMLEFMGLRWIKIEQ